MVLTNHSPYKGNPAPANGYRIVMKIKGMKTKKKFKEGCWVLVSCYWLIVACCWVLVACCLSPVTGC